MKFRIADDESIHTSFFLSFLPFHLFLCFFSSVLWLSDFFFFIWRIPRFCSGRWLMISKKCHFTLATSSKTKTFLLLFVFFFFFFFFCLELFQLFRLFLPLSVAKFIENEIDVLLEQFNVINYYIFNYIEKVNKKNQMINY